MQRGPALDSGNSPRAILTFYSLILTFDFSASLGLRGSMQARVAQSSVRSHVFVDLPLNSYFLLLTFFTSAVGYFRLTDSLRFALFVIRQPPR